MNPDRHKEKSDQELLAMFYSTGDNEYMGVLLQRYTLLLFGTCMKYLKDEDKAKDAVQQVYFLALHELQKKQVTYFKSWLYIIARNYCLMQFRSKGTKKISELPSENIVVEEDTLFDVIHKDRLLEMTSMALPEINEEQKICIILFYLEKKTYHEICLHTGFNLLQVKSFIQNGKRNLRKLIAQKMKEKYG